MRKFDMLKIVAAAMTVALPMTAQAAVTYSFSTSEDFYEESGAKITGSFSLTVASAIASHTAVPAASMTSCTLALVDGTPWSCNGADFVLLPAGVGYVQATNIVQFGVYVPGFGYFNEYVFADGAFTHNGSYETIPGSGGNQQHGFLTVSGIPEDIGDAPIDPPAVPEPASWALMIGGFALAGTALRRRAARIRFAVA